MKMADREKIFEGKCSGIKREAKNTDGTGKKPFKRTIVQR
jgi:hypothetical protein